MKNVIILILASFLLGYIKESIHGAERLAELGEWQQNFKTKQFQEREMDSVTWLAVIINESNTKYYGIE